MGTRASFFIGNPEHADNRTWLGCIAFDGYPDGEVNLLAGADCKSDFAARVALLADARDDWCDPAKHGFPFPWDDDLFLTDYTYAWFGGKVMMTSFHKGWIGLADYLSGTVEAKRAYQSRADTLPGNVPAPAQWDRKAPDSIIIVVGP